MYTNLINFFCLHELMCQTIKKKELTLVVVDYRKSFLRESEKMCDLKLNEFHKNTFTTGLQLLAFNFTEYRLGQSRSQNLWNI